MLGIYLICFSYAISTELVIYPLILVYPIIVSLSGVLFIRRAPKMMYTCLCIIGSIYYIICEDKRFDILDGPIDIYIACAISSGMILGLSYVTHIHETKIQRMNAKLESNEQNLSKKNIELEKYIDSNLQLENFAYLASHELKTPMRNVTNFTGLLMMKLKHKVEDSDEELLQYIKDEVIRMNSLIGDLLSLSQMSNESFDFDRFDPARLIEDLIADTFSVHSNHIHVGPLPQSLYGSQELMVHLIQNLIQNAIKFNRPNTDPLIHISGYKDAQFYHFKIQDSGIGIDEDYKEQIFLIFKRLHNQSDIKGNGIGLALCKKIVDRHGGKIWIEDNDAGGSTFHFTIRDELGMYEHTIL